MPEILLRLERERHAESLPLYQRLRALLPEAMQAFWRHYDEPDAVVRPESMEGYSLVRGAFVHYADAGQAERFLDIAADYGADVLRAAAEAFASAEHWNGARVGWLRCAAGAAGCADDLYGAALASLYMGEREQTREYLTQALAADAAHRKSMELMELIR